MPLCLNIALGGPTQHNTTQHKQVMGLFELLRARVLWKTLIIGITLQACQQLSGINAIFYYSASIFKDANVENGDVATAIVRANGRGGGRGWKGKGWKGKGRDQGVGKHTRTCGGGSRER